MSLATRQWYPSRSPAFCLRYSVFNAATSLSLPRFCIVRSLLTEAADQSFPEPRRATSGCLNAGRSDDEIRAKITTPTTRTLKAAPRICNVFYPPTLGQETAVHSVESTTVPAQETIRISVNIKEQARVVAQQAFTFIPEYNASIRLLNRQRLFISDLAVDSQGASLQVCNLSDNGIEVPANIRLGVVFVPSSTTGDGTEEDDEYLTTLKVRRVKGLTRIKIRRLFQAARRSQQHQEHKEAKSDHYHVSLGKRPNLGEMALAELEKHSQNQAEAQVVVERSSSTDSLPIARPQKRSRFREVHAGQIPTPPIWSKTSFVDYIEDLATATVSRSLHRQIYLDGVNHDETVARLLIRSLKDPCMSSYISTQACNIAFGFFYRHAMIPRVRSLFMYMEETNMVIPRETFNIMLRGAAAQSNIYGFTHILRLMVRRELRPDSGSWTALMTAVNSMDVRGRLLQLMFDRGLLETQNDKSFALSLAVRGELVKYLNQGQSLAYFLDSMDKKYGSLWISVSACNNMLDEIVERGLMREAYDLLELMSSRGLKPNNVTLNTILGQCLRLQDLGLAIQILKLFEDAFKVRPLANEQGQVGFDTLFQIAWRRRDLNCCRVIWRHACLRAAVKYRMQQLVMDSLLCNTPGIPQTRQEYWKKTAGKIIANVEKGDLHVGGYRIAGANILTKLIGWEKTGADRDLQLKLARHIIDRDLAAARRHKPREKLLDDLEKARDIDVNWAGDQVWKHKDVQWMQDHAVQVQTKSFYKKGLRDTNRVEHTGSKA